MLTINDTPNDQIQNIPSLGEEEFQNESEEHLDASEEDISEIEEYLAKEDIDPVDLRNKANKLIQLIKSKERDLLLAAQIGQSLLDANVNMQNQLKLLSENQNKSINNDESMTSLINTSDDSYGSPTAMIPKNNSRFDEPMPTSNSMRTGKKPISRSDSYDLNSYTNNLEEVNYKLQNQVEKLEESLKQNEQQSSKRIVLLENLLEQLQGELSELQVMNRDLEKEKRLLLEEKESSKKINEMSEKDTEKIIAQLFENKNKLADTVNKLEIKKKVLENELLDAMNGGSMLQNEIVKWKQEAEDCNKYKELYEQELQRVSVLESSLNSYRANIKMIKEAQMDLKRRSTSSLDFDGLDMGIVQSQDQLNDHTKLSEELSGTQGESCSHSRRVRRRRVVRSSNHEGDEADVEEEEEIEESEITTSTTTHHHRAHGHHRHHRHSPLRHIQPLTYEDQDEACCSVTPGQYSKEDNVVVLHGHIHHIEDDEEEDIDGTEGKEIVLRDKPCQRCGKIRRNRFSHPRNSRRSHSRVMRARAKRTARGRKKYSALVPLKSTGEEDEERNTLIQLHNNNESGFMGIYNTCKQAIENLDYSKTDLTRSQSAWKFIQFWFAMLCIFIGCIVVSYRRVFQSLPTKSSKRTISK